MNNATGTYRLSADPSDPLGSSLLHLIEREREVRGRYGNHGYLKGSMEGGTLTAVLRNGTKLGSMKVRFDESFKTFEGICAFPEGTNHATLRGTRVNAKS